MQMEGFTKAIFHNIVQDSVLIQAAQRLDRI